MTLAIQNIEVASLGRKPLWAYRYETNDEAPEKSLCRMPATEIITAHLPVDELKWKKPTRRANTALDVSVQELGGWQRGGGHLGMLSTSFPADARAFVKQLVRQLIGKKRLRLTNEDCEVDTQALYCIGSTFHNDLAMWDNHVFLNWCLAGPPMDLVLPEFGFRKTLQVGDLVLFDPAWVHALLKPGKSFFSEGDWTQEETHSPAAYSVFFSADMALGSVTLDSAMGIERNSLSAFQDAGTSVKLKSRVNKFTGEWLQD